MIMIKIVNISFLLFITANAIINLCFGLLIAHIKIEQKNIYIEEEIEL